MDSEKRICEYCKRSLVKIGCDRANRPSSYTDWKGRKYHKKCHAIQAAERNILLEKKLLEKKLLEERLEAIRKKEEWHKQFVEKNIKYWNETRLNNVVAFVKKWNNYEDPNDAFID